VTKPRRANLKKNQPTLSALVLAELALPLRAEAAECDSYRRHATARRSSRLRCRDASVF
jgi:hypothetical protein